jgi:hypothetical protein
MNLYEKINAIMGDVKSLKKDGKVSFGITKYNFLSEAKTTEIFHELFVKHKIVLLPISVEEEKQGHVTQGRYTYRMINCEDPVDFIDLQSGGQGHDSSDKGSGKASSYAYKYLLWRTFAIPSNDDPDQVSSDETRAKEEAEEKARLEAEKPITPEQLATLTGMIAETGADIDAMMKYYKVDDLGKLNVKSFISAMKNLEKKKEKKTNE